MDFIPVPPRYKRMLGLLSLERAVSETSTVCSKLLLEEADELEPEQLFRPMYERGLIELFMIERQSSCRITDEGVTCYAAGMMLKEQRHMNDEEAETIAEGAYLLMEMRP